MRALLLSALLLAPDGDKPRVSPLQPLCAAAKRLQKGMAEYLKGTTAAEAFKPWALEGGEKAELREAIRAAGVERTPSIGFEIYVYFKRKGVTVYRIRAEVHVTPTEASLFSLHGVAYTGGAARGLAASACRDQTAPFGEAAAAFAKVARIPFADRAALEKLVSEAMRPGFLRDFEDSRKRAAEVAAAIAALGHDEVWVHPDDLYVAALGADGAPVGGMIRARLALKEGGVVGFRLGRFERN